RALPRRKRRMVSVLRRIPERNAWHHRPPPPIRKRFPAAPFDERGRPFSGTSCASQATVSSELIPRIRPQIREVGLAGHPCPHTGGHLFSILLLMGLQKPPPPVLRNIPKWLSWLCNLGQRVVSLRHDESAHGSRLLRVLQQLALVFTRE